MSRVACRRLSEPPGMSGDILFKDAHSHEMKRVLDAEEPGYAMCAM